MIELFGHLFTPEDRGLCAVSVVDGVLADIVPASTAPAGAIGGPDSMIVPGLIDLQVNGAFGFDFADPEADVAAICRGMPRFGVTAFLPTIVPSPRDLYRPALENLASREVPGEARLLGAHLEGPFVNASQRGTHNAGEIRRPSIEEAEGWPARRVTLVTVAPELPGAIPLIEWLVAHGIRVSMGHTDATWEQAATAVAAGASLATHLFNTMRPIHQRAPGIAGFILANPVMTSVIADGYHVANESLRLIARAKAPDELFVISDTLPGFGLPPGRYVVAGRDYVSDGLSARLPDGTLTGGLMPLNLVLRNLVEKVGLDRPTAVRLATANPARAIGREGDLGRAEVGRPADLVVLDADWSVRATIVGGKLGWSA